MEPSVAEKMGELGDRRRARPYALRFLEDGLRHLHHSGAMGHGVPFDHSTSMLGDRALNQPPEIVEVAAACNGLARTRLKSQFADKDQSASA